MALLTVQLGVRNLLLHKLRSFLTLLGTVLGVASVIAMLAIGEGSKRKAVEQIQSQAEFTEVPYTPEENETEAVEHFIAGDPEPDIPEAKHGDAEVLKQPADHT